MKAVTPILKVIPIRNLIWWTRIYLVESSDHPRDSRLLLNESEYLCNVLQMAGTPQQNREMWMKNFKVVDVADCKYL